jgi:hypothetical protein
LKGEGVRLLGFKGVRLLEKRYGFKGVRLLEKRYVFKESDPLEWGV